MDEASGWGIWAEEVFVEGRRKGERGKGKCSSTFVQKERVLEVKSVLSDNQISKIFGYLVETGMEKCKHLPILPIFEP